MIRWGLGLALALSATFAAPTAAQAAPRAGRAVVVDANGQPLRSGSTSTQFTLRLPENSQCQGDSQDGNYRLQSFFVPSRWDPTRLTYRFDAPNGEGNQPLWDVFTNPYTQGLTGVAKRKGGPGPITNTPLFSFAVYTPRLDLIPSGTYRTGLACTLYNKTTRVWQTSLRVVTDPAQPKARQITWRVLDAAPATKRSPNWGLGALGGAVVGGVVLVLRRRSS